MSELSKTQRLLAERDKLNRQIAIESERVENMQDNLADEGINEQAANRIVGADQFMRRVDAHMLLSNERWSQVCKTLADLQEHGFRRCEGERVRIEHLEESDKQQWDSLNKKADKVRAPKTKAAVWGVGGAGLGAGAVYALLDWISKRWGG